MAFFAKDDVYAPCACGSGKKYKFCCLQKHRAERKAREEDTTVRWQPGREEPTIVLDLREGEDLMVEGLRLLEAGKARQAIPLFRRSIRAAPIVPQPHNNLALAHFVEGDIEDAVRIYERVDRELDPGNCFTLGGLIQCLTLLGRDAEAREALERLIRAEPRDQCAAYKKCEALARFREHSRILEAAESGLRAHGRDEELEFFAGTALANLGRHAEALERLSGATRGRGHGGRAARYVKLLRRRESPGTLEGDWPYLELQEWLPPGLLDRLKETGAVARYPGIVEGLLVVANDSPRECAKVLDLIGSIDTPRVREVLRKIASGTFGSDETRTAAIQRLEMLEGPSPSGPRRVWLRGEWKDVELRRHEISGEAVSRLPEHLHGRMAEMIDANRRRDFALAERIGRELLAAAPDCPTVYQNLASSVGMQGRADEGEVLLRKAIALDPAYLFAPASLAKLLLSRGRLEEAREVLKGARPGESIHPDAMEAYLEAQLLLALEAGELETVDTVAGTLRRAAPENPTLRKLDALGLGEAARLASELIAHRRGLDAARLRRILEGDPGIEACLELASADDLKLLRKVLGRRIPKRLRKDALRRAIAEALVDRPALDGVVAALPEPARAGLEDLLDRGGRMPFAEFVARHPRAPGESRAPLPGLEPAPADFLRALCLGALGTVDGTESIVVPREIRELLRPGSSGVQTSGASGPD